MSLLYIFKQKLCLNTKWLNFSFCKSRKEKLLQNIASDVLIGEILFTVYRFSDESGLVLWRHRTYRWLSSEMDEVKPAKTVNF